MSIPYELAKSIRALCLWRSPHALLCPISTAMPSHFQSKWWAWLSLLSLRSAFSLSLARSLVTISGSISEGRAVRGQRPVRLARILKASLGRRLELSNLKLCAGLDEHTDTVLQEGRRTYFSIVSYRFCPILPLRIFVYNRNHLPSQPSSPWPSAIKTT